MNQTPSFAIAQSLSNFQSALHESGESLSGFLRQNYLSRWLGDGIYHAMRIRTTLVMAMQEYLTGRGLLNMERVSLSPVTDPLAHDVEHTPFISYKGHTYVTTHSMIYSKFLACLNPRVPGIFVDSPNIRLEIVSPTGVQRRKYAIDFSQMDVEVRRNRGVTLAQYLREPDRVKTILREDLERAMEFFEGLLTAAVAAVAERNDDDLKALGVALDVPRGPFPRFTRDAAVSRYGTAAFEKKLGEEVQGQFFWVTGLMRENYDLIYPYLQTDGGKMPIADFTSDMIYNYDVCAQSRDRRTGRYGQAFEILSGAIREWLYEPIIERLIDNKVIPVRPVIAHGNIENIEELGGYGPFLLAVAQTRDDGTPLFPETFGGGVGIERMLFTLLAGEHISKVDDVMLFGKNPDSHPLYLF